ncbi:MAG: DUF362 domain-containing protein [Desulfobacterales bacterium]|nr:DUF362 domain-containing protein [Desulfobacterales bacterium]
MSKPLVAVVRYENPLDSVKKTVELCRGLENLPANANVFIKPNIVFWTMATVFPKWGVITTSRVVEDMVILLKEHGVKNITIGEGSVTMKLNDTQTIAHAFDSLGYNRLKERYGVNCVNILERPFEELDLGDGVELSFNTDILESDFVVNLPVLKTHAQTVISLGVKNLKGVIDIRSRKKCHSADPEKNLHFMVARLADKMPPMFTLIDGIYANERGPSMDGRIVRTNLLIGSNDALAADFVGAKILGYLPSDIPHLSYAAKNHGRNPDLSDIEVTGESIEDVSTPLQYDFPYNEEGTLPVPLELKGIKGVSYRKYDLTMCTYCSGLNSIILTAIAAAWKGKPWDSVEVLTGKSMTPSPNSKKTILLGKCMCKLHKDNPDIQEMIPVNGCPPQPKVIIKAFHKAGIDIDPGLLENMEHLPGFLMERYRKRPEFEESFFQVE